MEKGSNQGDEQRSETESNKTKKLLLLKPTRYTSLTASCCKSLQQKLNRSID